MRNTHSVVTRSMVGVREGSSSKSFRAAPWGSASAIEYELPAREPRTEPNKWKKQARQSLIARQSGLNDIQSELSKRKKSLVLTLRKSRVHRSHPLF